MHQTRLIKIELLIRFYFDIRELELGFCYDKHMKSVITEVSEEATNKYSTDQFGYERIIREQKIFGFLKNCSHVPTIVNMEHDDMKASIKMKTIRGKSLREIIGIKDEYDIEAMSWNAAEKLLKQYIEAEMDLLSRRALYRDMNLEHILFTNNQAFLVDLESTIISEVPNKWVLNDMRGTWETMAPEEFSGYGELNPRTATYRVAIIAHILLVGKLPFKRFPASRSDTHHWRLKNNAEVGGILNKNTQRVFKIALARNHVHRHKDPIGFFKALSDSYKLNR